MKRLIPIPAVLVSLALPVSASAQRPALTLAQAEGAARPALTTAVADDTANVAEYGEPGEPTTVSYRVDECDLETRYRAVCDYETTESDGTVEVGTMELIAATHGIVVRWL